MSKDPQARYASARDLADDLRRFQEHKPIRARRPTPVEHLAKWARRHRPAVAATSIALLLAMAVASALLWNEQRKTARALADLEAIMERERSTLPRVLMQTYATTMLSMQTFAAEHHDPNQGPYALFYREMLTYYEGMVHLTGGDTDPRMREVNAKALYGRGLVRMIRRAPGTEADYRASIEAFEKLAREFPDRHDLLRDQAQTLRFLSEYLALLGRSDDAEAAGRRAVAVVGDLVRRYPNEPEHKQDYAYNITRLAEMLAISGHRDRAEGVFAEAIEADPKNAETLNGLAWLLASQPEHPPYDPARALDLAERAVALEPGTPSFWNTLGVARLRNGRPDAAAALERSLKAGSSGKPAYDLFPLAVLHARRGDAAKARTLFDQAVEWTRQNPSKDPDLLQLEAEARAALGLPKPGGPGTVQATGRPPARTGSEPPAG